MEKHGQNYTKLAAKIELKSGLRYKVRLRVWGYSNGKYLYMALDDSLTLKYKN